MTEEKSPNNYGNIVIRIVATVLFVMAIYFASYIIGIVAAIQVVILMANGKPIDDLKNLSEKVANIIIDMIRYVLFLSNDIPAPFNKWFKA